MLGSTRSDNLIVIILFDKQTILTKDLLGLKVHLITHVFLDILTSLYTYLWHSSNVFVIIE